MPDLTWIRSACLVSHLAPRSQFDAIARGGFDDQPPSPEPFRKLEKRLQVSNADPNASFTSVMAPPSPAAPPNPPQDRAKAEVAKPPTLGGKRTIVSSAKSRSRANLMSPGAKYGPVAGSAPRALPQLLMW